MSFTIAQVKGFPAGTVVPKIEGTLKKVFPVKTGEGGYGPWKLQGFVFADGAEEIKGCVFDSDDITYLEGKRVTLISSGTNGKTKKQQGVSIEANKQTQAPEINVKGKLGGIVAADQPNPAYMRGTPENLAQADKPVPSAPPVRSAGISAPSHTSTASAPSDPVDTLERMAAFWLGCWKQAGKVSGLSESVQQSMTSCLFIEGNKQQLWRDWPVKQEDVGRYAPHGTAPEPGDPF